MIYPERCVVSRRPSAQTIAVLGELATRPTDGRHGYELGQRLDLKAGSLYPILMRLCDRGALEAIGETDPPAGGPPADLRATTGLRLGLCGRSRAYDGTWRTVGAVLALAGGGLAVVTVAARGASPGVLVEMVVLGAVLGALVRRGRSERVLGPARDRTLRAAGYLVVTGYVDLLVSPAMGGARHDPGGWWIAGRSAADRVADRARSRPQMAPAA